MHGRTTIQPPEPAPAGAPAPPAPPGERTTSPGAVTATTATLPHEDLGGAVLLLGVREAVLARRRRDGRDEVVRVRRTSRALGAAPYLVRIFDAIGRRSPVLILGRADERTAFEREFVRISHRPDCLLEDPEVHDAHPEALLARLRALRSHPG